MKRKSLIFLSIFFINCYSTNSEQAQNTSNLYDFKDTSYQVPTFINDTFILKCYNDTISTMVIKLNDSTIKILKFWCLTGNINEETYFVNGLRDSILKEYFIDGSMNMWRKFSKGIQMNEGEDFFLGENIIRTKYYMIDSFKIYERYENDGTFAYKDTFPDITPDSYLYELSIKRDTLIWEDIIHERNKY